MTEKIKARLNAILPTLRTLCQWLLLAGAAGTACGLAGAAFTWCVAQATSLRGTHPWLLYCMPLAGLVIVWPTGPPEWKTTAAPTRSLPASGAGNALRRGWLR